MPAHERRGREERPERERKISGRAQGVISQITSDIKALNSSILIISQKIKYLVRNEKILGRNLLVLNKKIKTVQEGRMSGSGDLSNVETELAEINNKLSANADAITQIQSDVDNIKENYAKAETVAEMKFVIDSINPLEFVSVKDVKYLMEGKKVTVKKKK